MKRKIKLFMGYKRKIKSSWFSNEYITLRYTTNGIFWKNLRTYEYCSLDKWCYMSTKISSIDDAKYLFESFDTIEKIKEYEDKQRTRVLNENKLIFERNKKEKEKRDNIYKKYGK